MLCRLTDGAYPLQVNAFLLTTVLLRGQISYPPGRGTSQICFFLRRKGTPFLFCWLRLAQLGPQPSRWRQAVSWRHSRLETTGTLWVLCRLTDGAGKTAFSFVGKWCVLSCSCFLPARLGPKPLFLLHCKRKSGSGLRKRKGRPVEMITGYATTVQSPNPAWLSHG